MGLLKEDGIAMVFPMSFDPLLYSPLYNPTTKQSQVMRSMILIYFQNNNDANENQTPILLGF